MYMTVEEFQALKESGRYSHSRAGSGCWRAQAWVYAFDPASPSGFMLAGAIPLDDKTYHAAPLSPTEPR